MMSDVDERISYLEACVASLRAQAVAKNERFASLMRRVFDIGKPTATQGKVRIVFVVDLDESSTGTDAEWSVSSQGLIVSGRNGETALAALADALDARN